MIRRMVSVSRCACMRQRNHAAILSMTPPLMVANSRANSQVPSASSAPVGTAPPVGGGGASAEAAAVSDACSVLSVREDLPLGSLLQLLSPASRSAIFKSGKGVEGFFRMYSGRDLELVSKDGIVSIRSLKQRQPTTPAAEKVVAEKKTEAAATDVVLAKNKEMCDKILPFLPEGRYTAMIEIYNKVFETPESRAAVKLEDFVNFVKGNPQSFWVHKRSFCKRSPGEISQPVFSTTGSSEGGTTPAAPTPTSMPLSTNNFGGWGAAANVPTAADVFEILKYIPVHWGNLGSLGVPPDVKKKHVRVASFLQWLRRQPRYFELRNIAGTIEVRRAVVLHPDQHGMTPEQAEEWLEERIRSGQHNCVAASAPATLAAPDSASGVSNLSPAALALHKFLVRVCPGYFVPASLILQRYVKKTLTAPEIDSCAKDSPQLFELLVLSSGVTLYRKKVGADSSRWRETFIKDVEGGGANSAAADGTPSPPTERAELDALVALMSRSCSLWDRYQYLYVRLTDEEKTLVGGFEGMVEIMKRHPSVFTCGEEYFRRHDPSDPLLDSTEPESKNENQNAAHACRQVDENPYLTPKQLILVFHYVTTDESPVTAAHLIECSSPAMRSVLPPRLITLLQMFPEFFTCKEITPGTFTIRKASKKTEDTDTLEGSSLLSAEETINSVKDLIPARGVDIGQLQLWVSLQTKHAAVNHFGGIDELINGHPELFYVVSNPPYRTVFLKKKQP